MVSKDWLDWLLNRHYCAHLIKYQYYKDKRNTPLYRLKRQIVKNVWLVSGVFMLVNPSLPIIVGTTLFTAFISFSILDET
jgi:GT2 family glycosyltransferase